MKKVLIYVEGQTEETFVRDVLAPELEQKCNLHLVPTLARTKRTKAGRVFKGGIVSYAKVKRDILRLLGDSSAFLVTTMIDYYSLPDDFPGKQSLPPGMSYQRVAYLEDAFRQDIGNNRFIPFLMLHEFEALLFVDVAEIESAFPDITRRGVLAQKTKSFTTPEEINEGHDTHPAARIMKYIPEYRKPLHGPLIVKRIGLHRIREQCPHFNGWIEQIERLAECGVI